MAVQFHSMPFSKFPPQGISGDLYYADDLKQLYLCAEGHLFPVDGILSGGISLNLEGPQGVKGEKGNKGDTGSKGDKGDKGDKGNTGSQGIQGIQGPIGDNGPAGS